MVNCSAADLVQKASGFRDHLTRVKRELAPDFEWYPYDSLANFEHIQALLAESGQSFFDIATTGLVMDIGCGDGDVALFLESLGCSVVAVDHPRTHHNGMRGVRLLAEHTRASVDVLEVDIDSAGLQLGDRKFSLVLALGLLYHLRNPFLLLDALSKVTKYCILSTRTARYLPGMPSVDISNQPVAYLVGESELNDDNSNYWIFSNAGLARLLERANWKILAWSHVGDLNASDPVSPEHDERLFCLLQSRWALQHLTLLRGWHEPEQEGWRWSERTFAAVLPAERDTNMALTLRFYLPETVLSRTGPVHLRCAIDGDDLEPCAYDSPGNHTYSRRFHVGPRNSVRVEFEASKCLPPEPTDPRERSLIVADLTLA